MYTDKRKLELIDYQYQYTNINIILDLIEYQLKGLNSTGKKLNW